jgi:hypothetical protein
MSRTAPGWRLQSQRWFRRSPKRLKNVHAGSDVSGEFNRNQISKFDQSMGQTPIQRVLNPIGVVSVLGLYLNVSYPPIPGLVVVFGRASSTPGNPRKPLVNPCIAFGLSYAAVVMQPMENNRSSREFGYQQCVGGSAAGQGSGQGTMFGCGGFPPVNQGFHPGYACRGSFSGNLGGRYGARGRPGGWAAQS